MTASPAPPDLHARIVARLADARRAAKLRQVDLAALLGWQQVYVSRLETGERQLGVDEYVAIALAIGIDPVATLAEEIDRGDGRPPLASLKSPKEISPAR